MCECKNKKFLVYNNELYVWDEEYCDFYVSGNDEYNFCPICGENLKKKITDEQMPF